MPIKPYAPPDPFTGIRRRRSPNGTNPLNEPFDPTRSGNALAGQVSGVMSKNVVNPLNARSDVAGLNTNIVSQAGKMLNPDLSDIDTMEEALYKKAMSRYEQNIQDRSKSLSAEAIGRGVYTSGGELDAANRRAFLESYARPLGETTEMLTAQPARDRAERRLSGLSAAQGVSSAQCASDLAYAGANQNILNAAGSFAAGQQQFGEGKRQFDVGAYGYDPNDASGSSGDPLNAPNVPRTTLASQELSLRGRAQTQSEQAQAGGYYDKDDKWVPTEAARATGIGERFTEAGLTGTLDGQQTLEAQNAALQRAIARGRETGTFVDPTTGRAYQTQAALEQAFSQKLRTSGLTGTLDGQQTLEAQNAALQRAIARGRETGTFVDPTTGRAYQTQAALEQAFSQKLSTAGLTGTLDGRQTLEAQNAALQRALARGRETGQFVAP